MAKEKNPSHKHCFSVDDAYTTSVFNTLYSVVLLLEILEHVKEDLFILQRIRNDTFVIFSVPNFPSATHVRWFPSLDSAASRYKTCINIEQAVTIQLPHTTNALYLFQGKKMNV
jgi:2-polyprenyl-3-methyl-5-hydroxy-6-metoxy-1,4-benzoquinol methylase